MFKQAALKKTGIYLDFHCNFWEFAPKQQGGTITSGKTCWAPPRICKLKWYSAKFVVFFGMPIPNHKWTMATWKYLNISYLGKEWKHQRISPKTTWTNNHINQESIISDFGCTNIWTKIFPLYISMCRMGPRSIAFSCLVAEFDGFW